VESRLDFGKPWATLEKIFRSVENILWRVRKIEVVECFGDSHVRIFRTLNGHPVLKNHRFRTVCVRGATAFGLGNPNSKTNSLRVFREWLVEIPSGRIVLFLMGEVDAGFLVWFRSVKYQRDPYDCLKEAIERYIRFLEAIHLEHPRMIICSAPLPTIKDGQDIGEVANARKEVRVSQLERTKMTLEFNKRVKDWALDHGAKYLDLDPLSYDSTTGVVNAFLLNKNESDHHYDPAAFKEILVKTLAQDRVLEFAH